MSAGETAVMALLNRSPKPTLIGRPTQGIFSDTLSRTLPGGWTVDLSNEDYRNAAGQSYEGRGIPVPQDGCDTTKNLRFTVSGAGPDSERLLNAGRPDKSNPHWGTASYTFIAQSRISHLRFDSVTEGHCGAVVTDVTAEE